MAAGLNSFRVTHQAAGIATRVDNFMKIDLNLHQ